MNHLGAKIVWVSQSGSEENVMLFISVLL